MVPQPKEKHLKLLLGLVIVAAVVAGVIVTGEINRQTDLQIPIYSNAQNVWRGRAQERIIRYPVTRIASFTTADSKDRVMSFYKTALESSGWRYDDDGHGGHVTLTCSSFLEGDFYVNSQDEHVWIAEYNSGSANNEYRLYKVTGSFWMYGDCF